MSGKLKYLFIAIFLIFGCSTPSYYKMDESKISFTENVEAIQTISIKDFIIVQDDLKLLSDDIFIQLDVADSMTIADFLLVIGKSSKIKFSFDYKKDHPITDQTAKSGTDEKSIVVGNYKGSVKNLLQMVQRSAGLFFYRTGDGFVIRDEAVCILRILPQQSIEEMQSLISKTFQCKDVSVDPRSGSIVFRANYRQYLAVADYLRSYPVQVADIDVVFTELEINDENAIGFDAQKFSAALISGGELTAAFKITGNNGFTISAQTGVASITAAMQSLEKYEKQNVLQRVTLSSLNNQVATVDVSEKVPYVSKVTTTSGQTGAAVRGYEFAVVSSGLTINITPVLDRDVLLLKNDLKYQQVIEFLSVGTADDQIQSPVLTARNITNMVSLRPGDVSKLATVRYKRKSNSSDGLYGLPRMLSGETFRNYEINVFGRVLIKRYIFE